MQPNLDADGIEIQTYEEIYEELSDGYKAIYGNDINLDPDSPDGQRVGIEAQAILDSQSFGLQLYNQLDPDFAIGQALNRLIKFSGIARDPAVRSYVDVTVTTDRILTLPLGYTVKDTIGQNWVTIAAEALISGANTVTLYSENFGAYAAGAGTVTEPSSIVIGVLTVTNPAIATVGEDEETDEALRIRRNQSLLAPQTSTVGGLYTALGDIADVTDLKIYENYTDDEDVTLTLDAHTLWCIIEGGTDAAIGEVLAKTKTGGTGLKGSETGTYVETITMPNDTTMEYTHEMAFDRPVNADFHIRFDVTKLDAAVSIDTDLLKAALVAHTYKIGELAQASFLYSIIYDTPSTFIATSLEISDDDIVWTDSDVAPDPDGRFVITTGNIDITEI